jgi:hypothetical protein
VTVPLRTSPAAEADRNVFALLKHPPDRVGGLVVACLSDSSADGLSSAHPYIGLGAGIAVVGLLQGFLIRFAALLGAAWVESRTED